MFVSDAYAKTYKIQRKDSSEVDCESIYLVSYILVRVSDRWRSLCGSFCEEDSVRTREDADEDQDRRAFVNGHAV